MNGLQIASYAGAAGRPALGASKWSYDAAAFGGRKKRKGPPARRINIPNRVMS